MRPDQMPLHRGTSQHLDEQRVRRSRGRIDGPTNEQSSVSLSKISGEADLMLRLLEQHPEYSLRKPSVELAISLGKTLYLLRALLDKGLVKAQNFRTSNNKLGYLYVPTPSGLKQQTRMTQAFLSRKEQEYSLLSDQIEVLRQEVATGLDEVPATDLSELRS